MLIECNDIPNNRLEIPFPHTASSYLHLASITTCIPETKENSQIDLLIGRDLAAANHVLDQHVIYTIQAKITPLVDYNW
jgi:hypothetical protein